MGDYEVNRFFSNEFRSQEFEQMLDRITHTVAISPELVRKYAQKALHEWEQETGEDVLTLFTANTQKMDNEISKMSHILGKELQSIIPSKKQLQKIERIADDSLHEMYRTP